MDFYKQLNYSIGNEDWHVEEKALRIFPNDTVACITASGDRPLHLLMTDCKKTISIDRNHMQNHLLELKRAAIAKLDFDSYMQFIGLVPYRKRYDILKTQLIDTLPNESAAFWLKHKKMIARGIIYQGRTERLTRLGAKFIKLFRNRSIEQLLAFDDIEEQRIYVKNTWDKLLFRKFFEVISNPRLLRAVLNDPGMVTYTDYQTKPGKYIYDCMLKYLETNLAKKSPLLQLILTGRVRPQAYFPYLTESGFHTIRRNLNRLEIHTVNVVDYLKSMPDNTFNAFSLSDIASYMPQPVFNELLEGVYASAVPGAHFCMREFISSRQIPDCMQQQFKRNHALEKQLESAETNFIYRFMVGDVAKTA